MLEAGAGMIPHPAKADRGGEDAFFICQRGYAMGVADGVGGWAEVGCRAGRRGIVGGGVEAGGLSEWVGGRARGAPALTLQVRVLVSAGRGTKGSCLVSWAQASWGWASQAGSFSLRRWCGSSIRPLAADVTSMA